MSDYLERALKYIGAERGESLGAGDVLDHAPGIYGDDYVVILDLGRKGCPKYRVPLSDLPELEPEEEPKTAEEKGLYALDYRELQSLAKQYDIPANQSTDVLIASIEAHEAVGYPGGEEE